MSPPPVWGEMAKWVGELGIVARGWQVRQWKSKGQDRCAGDVHPISPENTVLLENKQFNQPQHKTCERSKTKKSGAGFQKQKKKTSKPITVFCSISSSIPASSSSSSSSSTSSKHWSLNLLLHPTQLRFLDLRSCTPCGVLHEWYKKKMIIIATMRIYCMRGETLLCHFCCGL